MYIPSLRPETRYGMPMADLILNNRQYVVGYSFLFKQPRWTLQLINPKSQVDNVDRKDLFRPDARVPEMFRAELGDYKNSGYNRGHMASSADALGSKIINSETFLLSNMTMQHPRLNQGLWKELEKAIRDLAAKKDILEVYVMSGVLFESMKKNHMIGNLVVPHWYFKSVLAEDDRGKFHLWSFTMPNEDCDKDLEDCLYKTVDLEKWAGLELWDRVQCSKFEKQKHRIARMW